MGSESECQQMLKLVLERLRRWHGQHMVRGLMLLVGVVIGTRGLFEELSA
jgi:hypothetical protein